MIYFILAVSVVVATLTVCFIVLLGEVGLIPLIGLATSAFAFGYLIGEQTEQGEE